MADLKAYVVCPMCGRKCSSRGISDYIGIAEIRFACRKCRRPLKTVDEYTLELGE